MEEINGAQSIVSVRDLKFEYTDEESDTRTEVLKGVSLDVRPGEFLAVLGHNGSGKSTLAKHLNAILLPTSGSVVVDGIDTSDTDRLFDIRRRVGMVFQNPDNQLVATIVEEDVAFAPENLGVPGDELRRRVDEALELVGMSRFKRHAPHMLSGGQKQRVAIAGVLAMQPKILVMDEPTAMLDPSGRREVLNTVSRLNREQGMTVVFITHYMDEAVKADRVIVMDSGVIAMQGTPREIFPQVERLVELGLDTPQSTYLMYMLNKQGLGLDGSVLDDKECAEALIRRIKRKAEN
ncbi:MAG TPA: energy-coupling factor transporter ATPase [Candidatus Monoglobus merdigallinarum]|uniref:ABC transporter ATP-binding protein n=1 Tax=Candidatus Monoglobus merdigallinarum TaxID=2838698 RepID=A0A9D1PQ99_9FIRM|nr:energy-coupling factor transporter ATPase [Candidatus Monoglobus merdigallinarum]